MIIIYIVEISTEALALSLLGFYATYCHVLNIIIKSHEQVAYLAVARQIKTMGSAFMLACDNKKELY